MDQALYRLVIQLLLENKTTEAAQTITKGLGGIEKQAAATKAELERLGRTFPNPQTAIAAQKQLIDLAKQEADLRTKVAITADKSQRDIYAAKLKALGVTKDQIQAQRQALEFSNRQALREAKAQKAYAEELARCNTQAERDRAEQASADQRAIDQRLAGERRVADARAKQVEAQLNATLRERQAIEALRVARMQAYGTVAMFAAPAIAGAVGGALRTGIGEAGQLEMALTSMQIATGADSRTMDRLRSLAYTISDQTAQSVVDSAKNMAVLATSGLNDPRQLAQLSPVIARFADVQFYKNKTPFEESAKQGIQIAHLFGAYTESAIGPILEKLTQISFAMPDNLNRFLTQAGYYVPVFRGLGVRNEDALMAGAIIDRAGLGRGKGGTALQNLLLNEMNSLALTTHAQGKRATALELLGLTDKSGASKFYKWSTSDRRNEFDILGALRQIDRAVHDMPKGLSGQAATRWQAQRVMAVNAALGLTGERAALAITPEAIKNLDDAIKRIRQSGTMSQVQGKYLGTLNAQAQRFTSNFSSFLTDLMYPWLNQLRGTFSWLADQIHSWQSWLHQHRTAAQGIGVAAAGVAGGAGLFTANMILRMFGGGGLGFIGKDLLRIGGGIGGMFGLTAIRGLIGDVVRWGPMLLTSRAGIGLLGTSLGKIGLRAIPVIGEVLLLTETIKFLGNHSRDIGKGLAIAAHWIMTAGKDMLLHAAVSVWQAFIDAFKATFNFGHGGLLDWLHSSLSAGIGAFQHESDLLHQQDLKAAHHADTHIHGDVHVHVHDAHDPRATAQAVHAVIKSAGRSVQRHGTVATSPFMPHAQYGLVPG